MTNDDLVYTVSTDPATGTVTRRTMTLEQAAATKRGEAVRGVKREQWTLEEQGAADRAALDGLAIRRRNIEWNAKHERARETGLLDAIASLEPDERAELLREHPWAHPDWPDSDPDFEVGE
jgi:hypothetical protein